ncbi:MAG TPA: hypothetical protein VJH23_04530 [archaeon]|nr:hypothetical protein [archaeon]
MPEVRQLCEKIEKQVAYIREKAGARPWGNFSRPAFVGNLAQIIPEMEELYSLFLLARTEVEKTAQSPKPDFAEHIKDMAQLITVLKRNREMEEGRLDKLKSEGINSIAETITVPELYSDLEQKTLSALLKSTYASERLRVFDRRQEPTLQSNGSQKNILELLERKENELEDLRKKYEENRKNTFLGLAEKESSIEIENELNEITRKMEAKTALLKKQFEITKENFAQTEKKFSELQERLLGVEELESQATGRTFELMTMLKKERDYAKKMLIEIEHETIQLRNTYSKELLGMQEEKITLKNSLEDRYMREIDSLKREVADKSKTINHLQEMVTSREKRLEHIDEENHKLKLANATYHKHHTVKTHFLKKGKKHSK